MKKWLILAVLAFLFPILGSAAMFLFIASAVARSKQWQDFGMKVSQMQMLALDLADFCGTFWPLLVGVMVIIGWGLAGLFVTKAFSKGGQSIPAS